MSRRNATKKSTKTIVSTAISPFVGADVMETENISDNKVADPCLLPAVLTIFQRSQFFRSQFQQNSPAVNDLLKLYQNDTVKMEANNRKILQANGNGFQQSQEKAPFTHSIEHIIQHILTFPSTKDDVASNTIRLLVAVCEKIDKHVANSQPTDNPNAFTDSIMHYLLDFTESKDKLPRLRCCQIIEQLLDKVANISDELWDSLEKQMTSRMRDKNIFVRVAAIRAVKRLQNPSDPNCPITREYLNRLVFDTSVNVRKSVLECLNISDISLPHIIERTRDESEEIRECAFSKLGSTDIHMDRLALPQKMIILEQGLRDRGESGAAREACENMLCDGWLIKMKGADVVALLESLDIFDETNDKLQDSTIELIIKTIIKRASNPKSPLSETMKNYNWDSLIINPVMTHAPIAESSDDSFISSVLSHASDGGNEDDNQDEDSMLDSSARKSRNAKSRSGKSSSGAFNTSNLSHIDDLTNHPLDRASGGKSTISKSNISVESIVLWRVLYQQATNLKDESKRDTLLPDTLSYCSQLQRLVEKYENADASDPKSKLALKQFLLGAKSIDTSHDEVGRRKVQDLLLLILDTAWFDEDLISLSIETLFYLHESNDDKLVFCLSGIITSLQDGLVSLLSNQTPSSTNNSNNFRSDESSISALMDSTSLLLDSSVNESSLTQSQTLLPEEKISKSMNTDHGQQLISRILIFVDAVLQTLQKCPESDEGNRLSSIYSQLVLPLVQLKQDPLLRAKTIRLLGLFSLLDQNKAITNMRLLHGIMKSDDEEDDVKLMSMQSIFDTLLVFNKEQLDVLASDELVKETLGTLGKFLQSTSEILKFTAVEGLAKCFFAGRSNEPYMLYKLFLVYLHPSSESTPAIRQCLSVFFHQYTLSLIRQQTTSSNENLLMDMGLLFLRSYLTIASDTELSEVPLEKSVQYLFHLLQMKDEETKSTFKKDHVASFILNGLIQLVFCKDKKLIQVFAKCLSICNISDIPKQKLHEIEYVVKILCNIDDHIAKKYLSNLLSEINSQEDSSELNNAEKIAIDKKMDDRKNEMIELSSDGKVFDLRDPENMQSTRTSSRARRKAAVVLIEDHEESPSKQAMPDDEYDEKEKKQQKKKTAKLNDSNEIQEKKRKR